ncbi:hypothetical protein D3C86_1562420 [compost metagenome]
MPVALTFSASSVRPARMALSELRVTLKSGAASAPLASIAKSATPFACGVSFSSAGNLPVKLALNASFSRLTLPVASIVPDLTTRFSTLVRPPIVRSISPWRAMVVSNFSASAGGRVAGSAKS